jgi:hypothetical protein
MSVKIFLLNTNPFAALRERIPRHENGPCKVGTCKADAILIPEIPA